MRIDLIPERDRFIPGWHDRPEPRRAEQFPSEWRWPQRILGAVRALLSNLLQAYDAAKSPSNPRHIRDTWPKSRSAPSVRAEESAMRRFPASSHRSKGYDPPYHVPGGFCLPVQSPAPDYDVVPDLSARTDALPPRTSPTWLAALRRAGYSLIAILFAASRSKRAEGSAAVQRHARITTLGQ